jgi:hypothetical protein
MNINTNTDIRLYITNPNMHNHIQETLKFRGRKCQHIFRTFSPVPGVHDETHTTQVTRARGYEIYKDLLENHIHNDVAMELTTYDRNGKLLTKEIL